MIGRSRHQGKEIVGFVSGAPANRNEVGRVAAPGIKVIRDGRLNNVRKRKRTTMLWQAIRRRWISLSLSAVLVGLGATTVLAKPGTDPVKRPQLALKVTPHDIKLDPKLIQEPKATPIPFKPFTLQDAQGKAIDPKMKMTLARGKQMPAGDYLAKVNELEKALNARGRTLLTPGSKTKTVHDVNQKVALTASIPVVAADMQRQVLAMQKEEEARNVKAKRPATSRLAKRPELTAEAIKALEPQAKTVAAQYDKYLASLHGGAINALKPTGHASYNGSWWYDAHNSVIGGRIDAAISVDSNMANTGVETSKTHGEITGLGNVYNDIFTVFKFTGDLNSASNNQTNVNLNLALFGQTVYNYQKTANSYYADNWEPLDQHILLGNIDASYWIFDFSAQLYLNLQAGIGWSAFVFPNHVSGQMKPFFHSSLTGRGGVGLGIDGIDLAKGYIEGNLVLINEDLTLQLGAGLAFDAQNKPYVYADYGAYNDLDLLDGSIKVVGEVLGFSGSVDLFSWTGYQRHDQIFSGEEKAYLTSNLTVKEAAQSKVK
jgi:hypothetical protein